MDQLVRLMILKNVYGERPVRFLGYFWEKEIIERFYSTSFHFGKKNYSQE